MSAPAYMGNAVAHAARVATTLQPPPSVVLQLARAEDRIAQLEEVLGLTAKAPAALNIISPAQNQMLGLLRARERCPRDAMFDALYGGLPECDQPDRKIIKVNMRYLRSALRAHGVAILKSTGPHGNAVYFMTRQHKAKLAAAIEAAR